MRNPRWINLSKLREEIEHINGEIQAAQQAYDLNRAAELQYGKLPELTEAAGRGGGARQEPGYEPGA